MPVGATYSAGVVGWRIPALYERDQYYCCTSKHRSDYFLLQRLGVACFGLML